MMRKHMLTWIAGALIVLLLLPQIALMEAQTLEDDSDPHVLMLSKKEPDEVDEADAGWNRILSSYTLDVDFGQGMTRVEPVMRYAHCGPTYTDGIAMQSSLDYALNPIFGAIPEVTWTGALQIDMAVENDLFVRCSWELWRREADAYERVEDRKPVAEEVGAGRYLLLIEFGISRSDDKWANQEFDGVAFLWLNVGAEAAE